MKRHPFDMPHVMPPAHVNHDAVETPVAPYVGRHVHDLSHRWGGIPSDHGGRCAHRDDMHPTDLPV